MLLADTRRVDTARDQGSTQRERAPSRPQTVQPAAQRQLRSEGMCFLFASASPCALRPVPVARITPAFLRTRFLHPSRALSSLISPHNCAPLLFVLEPACFRWPRSFTCSVVHLALKLTVSRPGMRFRSRTQRDASTGPGERYKHLHDRIRRDTGEWFLASRPSLASTSSPSTSSTGLFVHPR